jgi:hypothetical protein
LYFKAKICRPTQKVANAKSRRTRTAYVAVEGESFGNKIGFYYCGKLPITCAGFKIKKKSHVLAIARSVNWALHRFPQQLNKVSSVRVDEERRKQKRPEEDVVSSRLIFLKVRVLPQQKVAICQFQYSVIEVYRCIPTTRT